eukprot:Sspe_Gene.116851::Locus_106862_Transcript_1_1_Confidence_1.000_Length_1658::g.116851::m.116851
MLSRWAAMRPKLEEARAKSRKMKSTHKGGVSRNNEAEKQLAEWIIHRRSLFMTVTRRQCHNLFLKLVEQPGGSPPKNMEKWWTRFRVAHRITTRRVGSRASYQVCQSPCWSCEVAS